MWYVPPLTANPSRSRSPRFEDVQGGQGSRSHRYVGDLHCRHTRSRVVQAHIESVSDVVQDCCRVQVSSRRPSYGTAVDHDSQ